MFFLLHDAALKASLACAAKYVANGTTYSFKMDSILQIDDDHPAAAGAGHTAITIEPKKLIKPSVGPSPFEVGLASYPIQPWTNRNAKLSQWFNYGFNPATWSKYSLAQIAMFQKFKQDEALRSMDTS